MAPTQEIRDAINHWVHEWLTHLVTQYVRSDHKTLAQVLTVILNFDEIQIQYKPLPQYSYFGEQEIRAKNPISNRITGLFGASATGQKFKPVIVGKVARPWVGKHQPTNPPVHYYHNTSARMTPEVFRDWFINCFLVEVQPIVDPDMQIQFIIDNCSYHNEDLMIMDPHVHIKFLPAKTSSLIQPMDQGVLAGVKAHQQKLFYEKLSRYCEEHTEAASFKKFVRYYTVCDAINDIAEGWKKVSASTIKKSFRKLIPSDKWNELIADDFDPDLRFETAAGIEDVLLNPGPTNDYVGHTVAEVLEVQDTTGREEDMLE